MPVGSFTVETEVEIRIEGAEGEAEQRRDRAERDVALVPVQPQAKHLLALEHDRALAPGDHTHDRF